jgi:hypothetical protein
LNFSEARVLNLCLSEVNVMAVKLHGTGSDHARQLITEGQVVLDEQEEQTKARYKFPYGDFKKVPRCAVISAESRAGQYKHHDIENAAAHLHGMLEVVRV